MSTWTRESVTAALRAWIDEHGCVPSRNQWRTAGMTPSAAVIYGHFDSWAEAIAAATGAPTTTATQAAHIAKPVGWMIDTSVHTLFIEDAGGALTAYAWIDEDGTIAFGDVAWPFPVEGVGAAMRALRASTGALMREVVA